MKLKKHNGIYLPEAMKTKNWIVTGTPGSGKTYLMEKVHGYPGEVCINISIKKWWTVQPLAQRPREIHLSLPFVGHKESLPVYDDIWSKTSPKDLPEVDFDKIRIPKKKKYFFSADWRSRFVFDFILPPPKWTFETRQNRLNKGDEKLVDVGISAKLVEWQTRTLWQVAWHFYLSGLHVLARPFNTAYPYTFEEISRVMRKNPKKGGGRVFPKDMNSLPRMTVANWTRLSSPKKWQKDVAKKKKPRPAL